MNIVAVGIECFAEVAVDVQRIGIAAVTAVQVAIGIRQSNRSRVAVFVVDVKADNFIHVIEQSVAIGISHCGGQASLLSLTMTGFISVAHAVVVAVGIQIVSNAIGTG